MSRELNFKMESQLGDNWCWAAVAVSIYNFYQNDGRWTQCLLAAELLTMPDCCPARRRGPCDKQMALHTALRETGNGGIYQEDGLSFEDIQHEIDAGRVIGVRIEWSEGGGHFLCITGYQELQGRQYVHLRDPLHDVESYLLSEFRYNYLNRGGEWKLTYLTSSDTPPIAAFITGNASLIRKALPLRKTLGKHPPAEIDFLTPAPKVPTAPYDIYTINYSALNSDGKLIFYKVGTRTVSTDKRPVIYDFNNSLAKPELIKVIHNTNFVNEFINQLAKIKQNQMRSILQFEIRVMSLPELFVESIWLHHKSDRHKDLFFLLKPAAEMVPDVVYSWNEFESKLFHGARERIVDTDKFLGG